MKYKKCIIMCMDLNLSLKNTNFVKKKIFVFVEEKCIECILERKFSSSLFQK